MSDMKMTDQTAGQKIQTRKYRTRKSRTWKCKDKNYLLSIQGNQFMLIMYKFRPKYNQMNKTRQHTEKSKSCSSHSWHAVLKLTDGTQILHTSVITGVKFPVGDFDPRIISDKRLSVRVCDHLMLKPFVTRAASVGHAVDRGHVQVSQESILQVRMRNFNAPAYIGHAAWKLSTCSRPMLFVRDASIFAKPTDACYTLAPISMTTVVVDIGLGLTLAV